MARWHHRLDGQVWVNSGRWWWTGRPGVLRFMKSERVGHDWATELNWTWHIVWLISSLPCLKYSPYETVSSMYISGLHLSFVFQSFLFSIWFDIFTWMSHMRPKLACLILNSWFYLKIYSLTSLLLSAKGKLRTWENVLIFPSPSPPKPIYSIPIDSVWKLHVVSFSPIPRPPH